MDGHLPSLGGLPANHGMVTHQSKSGHPVWPHLTLLGLSCVCLAPFGPFHPVLPHLAQFSPFGPVWLRLAPFGPI